MADSTPIVALDPARAPWDRQPGETPRRFGQFAAYRDQGRARTLRKTAETLTLSADHVRHVAAAGQWSDRAEAWDRHRDHLHDAVWFEARRDAAVRDAALLDDAARIVMDRVALLDPEELSPHDLIRALDVVLKHRRALYGDPVATVAVTGPGWDPLAVQLADYAAMTSEQRRQAIGQLVQTVQRRGEAATR